jgi:hypothetical protein
MAVDGSGVEVSSATLVRRLREKGLLVSTDKARETLKVRRRAEGRLHEVLHMHTDFISLSIDDKPGVPDIPVSTNGTAN